MKRAWHPDELAQCWTLSPDELELLGNKTGVTRLRFAVLLEAFQFDGRFPDRRGDVAGSQRIWPASLVCQPKRTSMVSGASAPSASSAPRFASTSASAHFAPG